MMKSNLLVRFKIKYHRIIITLHNILTAECDPANFAIRGVLIPILAIAGTIANIITIRVFNKPKMKSPTHTTLIGRYSYKSNSESSFFFKTV